MLPDMFYNLDYKIWMKYDKLWFFSIEQNTFYDRV